MATLKFKTPDGVWHTINGIVGGPVGRHINVKLGKDLWDESKSSQIVDNAEFFLSTGYDYIISPSYESIDEYNNCGVRVKNVTVTGKMEFIYKEKPLNDLYVEVLRIELGG